MSAIVPKYILRKPKVFRFLPKKYVDDFFRDGSLRINSFPSFRKHPDEKRLDDNEGKVELVHRTSERGGQTLIMQVDFGNDAYVLCGSMAPSRELMEHFECDSAIVINDTYAFIQCIARHIPDIKAVVEGPCSYQSHRMLIKDLGWVNLGPDRVSSDPKDFNPEAVEYVKAAFAPEDALFLKPHALRHHVEYRFIWSSASPIQHYLDLRVPEARQYCSSWHEDAEVIAF